MSTLVADIDFPAFKRRQLKIARYICRELSNRSEAEKEEMIRFITAELDEEESLFKHNSTVYDLVARMTIDAEKFARVKPNLKSQLNSDCAALLSEKMYASDTENFTTEEKQAILGEIDKITERYLRWRTRVTEYSNEEYLKVVRFICTEFSRHREAESLVEYCTLALGNGKPELNQMSKSQRAKLDVYHTRPHRLVARMVIDEGIYEGLDKSQREFLEERCSERLYYGMEGWDFERFSAAEKQAIQEDIDAVIERRI